MDTEKWWVTTGWVKDSPRYLAGPFGSQRMASAVREKMEADRRRADLYTVRNDQRAGEVVPSFVVRRVRYKTPATAG